MTSLSASWAGGHCKEQAGRSPGPSGNFSHTGSNAAQKWFGDEEADSATVVRTRQRDQEQLRRLQNKKEKKGKKVAQACFASFDAQRLMRGIWRGKEGHMLATLFLGHELALSSTDQHIQCLLHHQNLSSFMFWTITNLLCTQAHSHPLPPPPPRFLSSLPPLILPTATKAHSAVLAGSLVTPFPPLVSSSSWLTAGARPRLTFVISNPAGSAHKKSVVNSLSDLIPPLLFLMALPSPSSPLFYYHYLSFRLLGDTLRL